MRLGVVVGLPSDVDRFEPVIRRLPGAEFLEPRAGFPSPHYDARRATRLALLQRGRSALDEPSADFDLVLAPDRYSANHLQAWLSPHGRLTAWRDPDLPGQLWRDSRQDRREDESEIELGSVLTARAGVSLLAVSSEVWRCRPKGLMEVVTGDPISDGFFDVGAASRARAALGLRPNSERPLLTVMVDRARGAIPRWAPLVAALRSEFEVALHIGESARLDPAWSFPRCWRGPGLYVVDGGGGPRFADLLAASAAVIGEPSSRTRLAQELGVPTVGVCDGGRGLRRAFDSPAASASLPAVLDVVCEDPDHLGPLLRDAMESSPVGVEDRSLHRNAAARLADRLCAALQLLAN